VPAAPSRLEQAGGPPSEQLAEMYSQVASKNVPGTAQEAFNQARANYFLGKGPNPGRSVNAFANLYNLVKFKR